VGDALDEGDVGADARAPPPSAPAQPASANAADTNAMTAARVGGKRGKRGKREQPRAIAIADERRMGAPSCPA
jgi:hypothetical protein